MHSKFKLFPTYEVGSLPKLVVRRKALKGLACSDLEIQEVQLLARKYGVAHEEITSLLHRQKHEQRALHPEERKQLIGFNALLNIRIQEKSGLDYVYDGEARRVEMTENVTRQIEGFKHLPEMVLSRKADSWRKSVCDAEPQLKEGALGRLVQEEFSFVKAHATHPAKIPIDDPYMIAVMSDNPYYAKIMKGQFTTKKQVRYEAARGLTLSLAKNIIRPQVEAAVALGATWIQLDLPAATIDAGQIPILVEGLNTIVEGIDDVNFSLHFCYPRRDPLLKKKGYALLFPHALNLNYRIKHFSLELANADTYREDLAVFAEHQKERYFALGVGVIDITSQRQKEKPFETPELVRERILRAAEVLKDHTLVYVAPDCGMRQLSLERCIRLYEIMVEGAELARRG